MLLIGCSNPNREKVAKVDDDTYKYETDLIEKKYIINESKECTLQTSYLLNSDSKHKASDSILIIPEKIYCSEGEWDVTRIGWISRNFPKVESQSKYVSIYDDCVYCETDYALVYVPKGKTDITLPDKKCVNLELLCSEVDYMTVNVPASVESIVLNALGTNIYWEVSPDNQHYSSVYGDLFNKDQTILVRYHAEDEADSYEIPNTVKVIGYGAFSNAKNLNTIVFPPTLTTIGEAAFYGAENLYNLAFESQNKTKLAGIDTEAQKDQYYYFVIPYGIEEIGDNAFTIYDIGIYPKYPHNHYYIVLPPTLKKVHNNTFKGICENVKVIFTGECPKFEEGGSEWEKAKLMNRYVYYPYIYEKSYQDILVHGAQNGFKRKLLSDYASGSKFKPYEPIVYRCNGIDKDPLFFMIVDGMAVARMGYDNKTLQVGPAVSYNMICYQWDSWHKTLNGQPYILEPSEDIYVANDAFVENTYIDLGLPSGTLWRSKNEEGLFTYGEVESKFDKSQLPTKELFEELKELCQWTWTGKGYKVEGPNGNHIFLPAAGISDVMNGMRHVGLLGNYWSSTRAESDLHSAKAWLLGFDNKRIELTTGTADSNNNGLSVRLVIRSAK